jgi:tetratricopeptide (TPR) repeat protein/predicted Ser/Thr protein kinase
VRAPIGELIRARLRSSGEGGRLGRYLILRLLGEGGMGLVFAAYDEDLDRKVAIKLLRTDGPAGPLDKNWLLAEAKAMARLSHPNVVQIYDVGELEGQIFVAMELVTGASLRDWLRQERRTIPEITRVFVEAGRGLAAVHRAGLVHRDFKPQNVLVADDGRVRVLDFGLALFHLDLEDSGARGPGTGAHRSLAATAATSATTRVAGRITAGTPAYMSPEQLRGDPTDARSDQFAFCVALYEALFHERPYPGKNLRELRESITAGKIRPPPADTRVPARLRKLLLRGLDPAPARRWSSMSELLAALDVDPRRRVIALLGLALLLALLTALALAAYYRALAAPQTSPCEGGAARIAATWGPPQRDAVAAAFTATGVPYAGDTLSKVHGRFDMYTKTWSEKHRDLCEDHRRGELSPALYDRAAACLDAARRDLGALAQVLAAADAAAVERAIKAADKLPGLDLCDDRQALLAQLRPPEPAAAAAVDALRGEIAVIRAEVSVSRRDRCGAIAGQIERARELAYRPLLAEALALDAACVDLSADFERSAAVMRDAALTAITADHTALAIEQLVRLSHTLGYRLARYAEADLWLDLADALVVQSGRDDLGPRVLTCRGGLRSVQGELRGATEAFDLAIGELTGEGVAPTSDLVAALHNRGAARAQLGDKRGATDDIERSIELARELLGREHPDVAMLLTGLGNVRLFSGDHAGAMAIQGEALALKERLLGPEHPDVATILANLAGIHQNLSDYEPAEAYFVRALAIRERALGPDNPGVATLLTNIGEMYNERGLGAEALTRLERALAIRQKTQDPDHPYFAGLYARIGRAELLLGRNKAARAHLEQAAAIGQRSDVSPADRDYCDLYLAKARWLTSRSARDKESARVIAEAALARLDRARIGKEAAEIEAWLAALPPR